MLAIRLQRTGRSGHSQFRVIVQDSRFSPKRGKVVDYLGSYDPHAKTATIDGEKAAKYMDNGAQPSDTVAKLFQKEGIKLPGWVNVSQPKKRGIRNPEKRRSTAPKAPAEPTPAVEQSSDEKPSAELAETETPAPTEAVEETAPDETPYVQAEAPAEAEPENTSEES
jgi:small subunit ribosomal protein S16